MANFVFLVADLTGRYAHVYLQAPTKGSAIDQLEDVGCEVIEDQTDDYELEDFASPIALAEVGAIPIDRLTRDTDFVPHG